MKTMLKIIFCLKLQCICILICSLPLMHTINRVYFQCAGACKHFFYRPSVASITFNTLRPRQNGCHFTDNTSRHIFMNENVRILIKISLKFVPTGQINNIPALVQIMVWRQPGDKPLSEPMMVRLPMHICITRPQSVKIRTGINN